MKYTTGTSLLVDANLYVDEQGNVCSCFRSIDCRASTNIYNITDGLVLMKVPGIVASCLPMKSLLLSTIECSYNQTCIDTLMPGLSPNETFSTMMITNKSRRIISEPYLTLK